jgi:pilus assembly protein CpaE
LVDQALGDRRLAKSAVEIKPGGLEGAIAYFGSRPTPALIVVEASESGDNLIEKINVLAEVCDSGARVLVLGSVNDVSMYRSLIQQGVSDYLVPPFTAKQIIEAVATICIDPAEPSLGRVLSFMATKGGAGSSTIAHNTAWHLAHLFADDVAVLDLDLAFGTLGLAFNTESVQSINEVLAHPERLDEVLLERFMVKRDDHLMLLTAPCSLDTDGEIEVDSFDVLLDLVRRAAPFVVLDIPYRWSHWTGHVLSRSDEIVLTSTLDLACLRDTKSLYTNLSEKRVNDAPIRLVLNHQGAYRKSQLSVKDFESTLGASPALVLQHDPVLFGTAANNGQMIGDFNKRSRVNDGLKALAQSISGRDLVTNNKRGKGAFSFFKKNHRKG